MEETHGTMVRAKQQSMVKAIYEKRGFFEIATGRRHTINFQHLCEMLDEWKDMSVGDWWGCIERDVTSNSALYLSNSINVSSLLTKPFEQQKKALNTIIMLAKNAGKDELELTASEWLMFTRACEHMVTKGATLVIDGVDMHAAEVLNSIDGAIIQGLKSVVKENDVQFLQRKETGCGNVWAYSVRKM